MPTGFSARRDASTSIKESMLEQGEAEATALSYDEERHKGIGGQSRMNKARLQRAVGR